MLAEAAALLFGPIALGAALGLLVRRRASGRLAGMSNAGACLVVPTLVTVALVVWWPIVGLWDGVTEGVLCGAGVVLTAHRACADWRDVALAGASATISLVLLEAVTRALGPAPPVFPTGGGVHLLLAGALRTAPPDGPAFRTEGPPAALVRRALTNTDLARPGDTTPPDDRPPSAAVATEIACSIAYGPAYVPLIDVQRERTIVFPDRYIPRVGAARRVLHVGDSMVYGANVPRDQTFTADLERLEPDVEHVNGGVSGTAPDDYFVLIRDWTARHRFDLVAMYVFTGNDLEGLDAPHPCARWQSLLVYDGGRARLRFSTPQRDDRTIGFRWLVINSPPPYLVRALITEHSAAAAFFGHALTAWTSRGARAGGLAVQLDHLEAILRSLHEELRAKGIPLVMVALPAAAALDSPGAQDLFGQLRAISERLDIPELDATSRIREALARGLQPVQPDGSHFSETGHGLIAQWLHENLKQTVVMPDP